MARPKKHDDEKRSEQTKERWTVAELEYLNQQADHAGLTRAEFIRRRALSLPVSPARSPQSDPGLVTELNRLGVALKSGIGNNLNQLVHHTHIGRHGAVPVDALLVEVQATIKQLDAALQKVIASDP